MPLIQDTPVDATPVATKTLKAAAPTTEVRRSTIPECERNDGRLVPDYTPMKPSGLLDQYAKVKVTPSFGTEFKDVDLVEWMNAPNSDELIRELGIMISRRGLVSFRSQKNMTNDLQKELCRRLGKLTNHPEGHDLYQNPMSAIRGHMKDMQTLDIKIQTKTHVKEETNAKQTAIDEWHTDVAGEACPASYTMLRMTHVPECGNDTMFVDGYAMYERLSKPWQKFAETLDQSCFIPGLHKLMTAEIDNPLLNLGPRGAPQNVGVVPPQTHPVVRTNPVTGWKALFHSGLFFNGIEGFTDIESKDWYEKMANIMTRNHDIQYRHKWENEGDMAIWDNRCSLHAATIDYDLWEESFGRRLGMRCNLAGERPFYDPTSISRSEELGKGYA